MKNIMCYGDSNTYGYNPQNGLRYPPSIRWPKRLQALLGQDYYVVEEGCNGRTTVFVDPEEEWKTGISSLKPILNSHKPLDLVILMLGSNDLKYFYHADARSIAAGAGKMVEEIRAFSLYKQGYAPQVLLISPPVLGDHIEDSAFGDHFKKEAVEESRLFGTFFEEEARKLNCPFLDAALLVSSSETDCLHLTAEAHAILAKGIAGKVLEILTEPDQEEGGQIKEEEL